MIQNQIKQEEIVVEGIVVTDKKAQQYDNFQQGNCFQVFGYTELSRSGATMLTYYKK